MPNIKSYETSRLFIRPTEKDDALFMLELLNTPKWLEYIGDRKVYTEDDALKYIEVKILPQFERLSFGNYVVIRKEDNAKIGTVGLYDRPGLEGVDIGFAFLPEYEQKGYAFEAAEKLRDVGFNDFNLTEINAITVVENESSRRLLERLGLEFVKMIDIEGDDAELMFYQMKKSE